MTLHDTTHINDLEESTRRYIRELAQHMSELAEALTTQQEALRPYGMRSRKPLRKPSASSTKRPKG